MSEQTAEAPSSKKKLILIGLGILLIGLALLQQPTAAKRSASAPAESAQE